MQLTIFGDGPHTASAPPEPNTISLEFSTNSQSIMMDEPETDTAPPEVPQLLMKRQPVIKGVPVPQSSAPPVTRA
jgi:hypothetical protein